jgi:hypothetical protein
MSARSPAALKPPAAPSTTAANPPAGSAGLIRTTLEVERQRSDALARANRIRSKCRDLREHIAEMEPNQGAALVARVLLNPPAFAAKLKTARLLQAIHGFGAVRAQKIAGDRARVPIGQLSYRERVRIAAQCVRRAEGLRRRTPPPAPTREVSEVALFGANQVRIARAKELREIAAARGSTQGLFRAAKLLNATQHPPGLDKLTVLALLEAVPGIGTSAARKFLRKHDVGERIELWMLSPSRALTLATALIAEQGPTPRLAAAPREPALEPPREPAPALAAAA